jgi:phospholipid/cholesterol/gamma-HCH transport system substrate-binding protein
MAAIRSAITRFQIPLLFGLAAVLTIIVFRLIGAATEYRLVVPLDSADGLYPGSDVLIAGARAGSVQELRLDGQRALVTIVVDDAYAPVHSDATIALRPKSLLGEKYLALDPGHSGSLDSGTMLRPDQVKPPVDLQDVVNTLDAPTREKLRTLVIELGGGVAGRSLDINQTISYGSKDINDLAAVTDVLAQRDADLEKVIQGLDTVTAELARSDRRQELGSLIQNSQRLLASLSTQDAQIKKALVESNATLGRTDSALSGTSAQLNQILTSLPQNVHTIDNLGQDLDLLMKDYNSDGHLMLFQEGIPAGTTVFSGHDTSGFGTRVSVVVGADTRTGGLAIYGSTSSNGKDPLGGILGFLQGKQP